MSVTQTNYFTHCSKNSVCIYFRYHVLIKSFIANKITQYKCSLLLVDQQTTKVHNNPKSSMSR